MNSMSSFISCQLPGCRTGNGQLLSLVLLQNRLDRRRELRALREPVVDAGVVDLDVRWVPLRVVVADLLDHRRARSLERVRYDDPVERGMGRAATAQANLQHEFITPSKGPIRLPERGVEQQQPPPHSERMSYCMNSGGSPFIIFPNFLAPKPLEKLRIIFFICRY